MSTRIRSIPLGRLVPHPDNPNRMSRGNIEKLVRNIERSGRYEPIVVRPCPGRRGYFQIINGHHRCEALQRLGRTSVDAVVWNVDDEQTDILLSTLNRLGGRDILEKKQSLLTRLAHRIPTRKLARLLPQTLGQIERLIAAVGASWPKAAKAQAFAIPMVFFVDGRQQQGIEAALASAERSSEGQTRAARRAEALTRIATRFLAPPEREPKSSGS